MQVAWLLRVLASSAASERSQHDPKILGWFHFSFPVFCGQSPVSRSSSITPLAYIIFASLSVIHASHLSTNRQHGLSSFIHPRSLSRSYHRLKRSDRITFSYLGTNVGNTNSCGYLIPWLIPLSLDDDSLLRVGSCMCPLELEVVAESKGV